ncbi:MAG: ATP-binding cassette domain-containing protein [Pseudomonadota bacterium]
MPLTMTVANGTQAKLTAELNPKPRVEPASQPRKDRKMLTAALLSQTPKPHNVNRAARPASAERLQHRAALAEVYAGLLGIDIARQDVLDHLRGSSATSAAGEAAGLVSAFKLHGLIAEERRTTQLDPALWPALAFMKSGQVLLILGQARGAVTVFDTTCPDNRADIPLAEFVPHFAGLVVKAEAPLDQLDAVHKVDTASRHWFWGEFQSFRGALGEIALGSFVANVLAVAVALFSLQVYDRVIPHQSHATLWVLAIGAGLALLLEAALKIARARMMDGAGRAIELRVLRLLMDRVMGARSDRRGQAPSMTFSAMREFGSVREFFTASTIGTLADIPFIFVFLLLVASIAGPVVWVLILGGVLMVVPGVLMQKRMLRLTQETQGASAKSTRLLHETIFEADTVKTARGEDRVARLWAELTTLSAVKTSEQRRLSAALTYWSQGVQQLTYVAAVIAGTYLVFAGQFTVGSIIAVGILTSRTLAPLTQLAGTMARWGNVKAALEMLDDVADATQDADPKRTYLRRDALKGHFEMREVTFRYDDDGAPTLDIPQAQILPGQKVAVLGANGAGKSSLLKLLTGLYAPTAGRVLIDGTEMSQIEPRDLRRLIGYLGQDVRLFTGTLRDNLNLTMLERDDARLMHALDFAGLGQFVRSHHKGLDLEIHDGGRGLSIGQRQSIGWARLWLQDPSICLLDEPTAALDQRLEATLVNRLGPWLADRTAVIATHRAPILSLTSRTLVLNDGRMRVDGPRDEVLAHIANAGASVPHRGHIA